jgi:hypothetical protein
MKMGTIPDNKHALLSPNTLQCNCHILRGLSVVSDPGILRLGKSYLLCVSKVLTLQLHPAGIISGLRNLKINLPSNPLHTLRGRTTDTARHDVDYNTRLGRLEQAIWNLFLTCDADG